MQLKNLQAPCAGCCRRSVLFPSPSLRPVPVVRAQKNLSRPELFKDRPASDANTNADEEDGFLWEEAALDNDNEMQPTVTDTTEAPVTRHMSTMLTPEELAEIQLALVEGPMYGRGSSTDEDADVDLRGEEGEQTDSDGTSGYPPDFWSTDRERVFLVGVDLQGRRAEANAEAVRHAKAGWANGAGKAASSGSRSSRADDGGRQWSRSTAPVKYSVDESLEELGRLADTAGLKVVGSTYQSLEVPNNSTYIGSGKVAEVARTIRALNAETVLFDCELAPGQLRNLEKALAGETGAVRVGDRTALILDIFSQRAATREGKLQVELAQVEYQLPRLSRMWTHLDRVGGGGQVKGAGEKQIEMDKRLLRDRAASLRKELDSVRGHRRAYRERRAIAPIPVVALVGYTNAGKSTLLNRLTDAGVLAEDKLFATLDPTTRKIRTRGNRELLISDTVGFIQKLPTELVAAFRATLEEVQDATVLLHLVDISHPNAAAQCEAVLQVLDDLGVGDIPLVTAWNKLDACPDPSQVRKVAQRRKDTVCVSGLTGEGVDELLDLIVEKLTVNMTQVEVMLPYAAGDLLDDIHRSGQVIGKAEYTETGVLVSARVPAILAGRLREYRLDVTTSSSSSSPGAGQTVAVGAGSDDDGWEGEEGKRVLPLGCSEDDAWCETV